MGLIFALGVILPFLSYAAETPSKTCVFEPYFERIEEIRANPLLDYFTRVRNELGVRNELLRATISCSRAELATLKDKLNAIPEASPEAKEIKERFADRLVRASEFYDTTEAKIPDLGLEASRTVAKEVLSWRQNTVAPLTAQILNFIIWQKNQELFLTAESRFADIQKMVERLSLLDNATIGNLFRIAKSNLADARNLNTNARDMIAVTSGARDPLELIQGSLTKLADTYKNFFDLSEAVKGILPH